MAESGPRILFVNRMLSMERGGGETFDLEIARCLEGMECEISYLSGIPVFGCGKVPLDRDRSFTLRTPWTGWFPWDVVRGGWRLRRADFRWFERAAVRWAAARHDRFDLVQVCELPGFVAAWKARGESVPVIMRLTAPNFDDPDGGLEQADGVIASGMTVEAVHAGRRPDCVDIPNAVDTARFAPASSSFRRDRGIDKDALVILYVARFQAFKNHALLVDAFAGVAAKAPDAVLVLGGSGPLRARVRRRVAALGLSARVIFLGEVPFEDVPGVYAASDIKVIASDYESFCFAALEAMATGLPVVTTDCGWVPRLIEGDRGGVVVPIGDRDRLAAALVALGGDADARREMGAWNRERAVARHGWQASAEKLLALYGDVLGRAT